MVIDFTSDEFKILKGNLLDQFKEYTQKAELNKYHKVISIFLEILGSDSDNTFFKTLNDVTFDKMNNFNVLISNELTTLENDLKIVQSVLGKEKVKIQQRILHSFTIILYIYIYSAWYSTLDSDSYRKYSNIVSHINKELMIFDNYVLDIILTTTRIISKNHYDNYVIKNNEFISLMNKIETIKSEFQETCDNYKTDIKKIEDSLNKQRQEFNFIGLSDAFQKIKGDKQNELKSEQEYNIFLRVVIAILLSLKLSYAIFGSFSGFDAKFAFISISSIFLIAVLIYFFRISLINIKSIKSQILQLDLRLSLCQFIHNYAEDSEKMRSENMKDSLDRFESIIFSPIVANEEQIPTTFDNLDQFIKMMNIANGGKGETK